MSLLSKKNIIIADMQVRKVPIRTTDSWLVVLYRLISQLIFSPHFACVFLYRVNVSLAKRFSMCARLLSACRYYMFGNEISYRATIGPGFRICHLSDIVIGANVVIGKNFNIYNGVTIGAKYFDMPDAKPHIGNNVIIGTGSKILGDIHIDDNVTVGALTIVDKDVSKDVIVYGNPMRIKEK